MNAKPPFLRTAIPFLLCLALFGAVLRSTSATYEWSGAAKDGSWHNATNWIPRGVPGAQDDVRLGIASANSTLRLSQNVEIRGFTNTHPVTLTVEQSTLLVKGEVEFEAGIKFTVVHAQIRIERVGELRGRPSASEFLLSQGSQLYLPNLTEIFTTGTANWKLEAASGSMIELQALTQVTGASQLIALGEHSEIRLPALESMSGESSGPASLIARSGARLVTPKVRSFRGNVSVSMEKDALIDLTGLREFTGPSSKLEVLGHDLQFTSLTRVEGCEILAEDGSHLAFPAVTDWVDEHNHSSWVARVGSSIDFPNISEIFNDQSALSVQSLQGGLIRLPELKKTTGMFNFVASGADDAVPPRASEISLDKLEVAADSQVGHNLGVQMKAAQNGRIRLPRIQEMRECGVVVLGPGRVEMESVQRLSQCQLEFDSVAYEFGFLTNAPNLELKANTSSLISLPAIRDLTGSQSQSWYLRVYSNSRLTAANLQAISGILSYFEVFSGGQISMANLSAISGFNRMQAGGTRSLLSFPELTTYDGPSESYIHVCDGAVAKLAQTSGRVRVLGGNFAVSLAYYNGAAGNSEGSIEAPEIIIERFAGLRGRGIVNAHVVVHGQVGVNWVQPKPNRPLRIQGDLDLAPGGSIAAMLFSNDEEPEPTRHVQLVVEGNASLSGSLLLSRNGRRIQMGDSYQLLRYNRRAGAFTEFRGLDGGGGLELKPDYSAPNVFVLTPETAAAPRIVAWQPRNTAYKSVSVLSVEFSEPIDSSSFAASDVSVFDPEQKPIPVTSVVADPASISAGPKFLIQFNSQAKPGTYRVVVGPEIRDFAGIAMESAKNWTFTLESFEPPVLRIGRLPANRIQVDWTLQDASEFALEASSDLPNPASWLPIIKIEKSGRDRRAILDPAAEFQAFRLKRL